MGDWLLALPLPWMTLVIFTAAYLVAAGVYLVVVGLAVNGLARVFKAFSPQMLTPLGVIFGLIVGFVALQTWNDFDKAKVAVDTEASALRVVVVLDESLPEEQRIHLRTLINRHIDEAVNREWPAMAQHLLTLASPPTALVEALQLTVSLKPQDESQRMAQREIIAALNRALDARRQRITISQSGVGPVQWAAILLLGLCMLIAIAMVHSDNRRTCAIAVTLFATGIGFTDCRLQSPLYWRHLGGTGALHNVTYASPAEYLGYPSSTLAKGHRKHCQTAIPSSQSSAIP